MTAKLTKELPDALHAIGEDRLNVIVPTTNRLYVTNRRYEPAIAQRGCRRFGRLPWRALQQRFAQSTIDERHAGSACDDESYLFALMRQLARAGFALGNQAEYH